MRTLLFLPVLRSKIALKPAIHRLVNAPQFEFDFEVTKTSDGLDQWRQDQRTAATATARDLGLPLGRKVQVSLSWGPPLHGHLLLHEPELFNPRRSDVKKLMLCVDGVPFAFPEMTSCVTVD